MSRVLIRLERSDLAQILAFLIVAAGAIIALAC